jgi:RNA-binding protein YlmH
VLENIYQHFKKSEQPFIERMNEQLINVRETYTPILTDFLNPRQLFILESLIRRYDDLKYRSFGGYEQAESQRVVIVPDFMLIEDTDFRIAVLEVSYPTKFAEINHSQILGTFLAQGLERSKLGDIISDGVRYQVIVDEMIADFLIEQVERVASIKIRLAKVDLREIIDHKDEFIEENMTITSVSV